MPSNIVHALVVMLMHNLIETNDLLLSLYLLAGGAPLHRWRKAQQGDRSTHES